jgi:hypothetical protein
MNGLIYVVGTMVIGVMIWFMVSTIMEGLRHTMMLNHIRLPAPGLKWELIKLIFYIVIVFPLFMTMARGSL